MNNFIKLYLLSSLSLSFINADTTKFGLGSCLDQDYPQPIWEAIEKEDLDYFVFLGDNVYGDLPSGSLRKMVSAYKKQKNNIQNRKTIQLKSINHLSTLVSMKP